MRVDRAGHEPRPLAGAVSRPAGAVPALTMFGRSSAKPIKVEVFAKTDLGRTRDHNEDRFLVADLSRREASLQPAVRVHEIGERRSEEHTSELQSHSNISYAVFCLKKKK